MKQRILIVEDERHIGVPLKFNFEAEGYEATLVEDGPSAVKHFEAATKECTESLTFPTR